MKILFLTYDFPFPLNSGGKIRAYHFIKNLAKKHQITLFSFFRREEQKKYLSELKPLCQKIVLFNRIKAFSQSHLLKSIIPSQPFPIALYHSLQLKKALIKEVQSQKYDLVHFESFYTSLYLNKEFKIPQVLGTENIEWLIYREFSQKQKFPLFKALMNLETFRIKWYEEKSWTKADLCLAVSLENAAAIEKITRRPCPVIPNGVDLSFFNFHPPRQEAKTLLFVGNFSYIQNQDAVRFLVKDIFPLIKKSTPQVRLVIVGRQPTKEIKKYAREDIKILENITDIRQAYQQADLLLAPIRAGSGTKFKIIEALASGLPVITTSVGIEGINAVDGCQVIVRDDSQALALAAIDLFNDFSLRQKLSRQGRQVVEKEYNWSLIVNKLEKAYQELINEKN